MNDLCRYILYFVYIHAVVCAVFSIKWMSFVLDKTKEYEEYENNKPRDMILESLDSANNTYGTFGVYTIIITVTIVAFFTNFIKFDYVELIFSKKYRIRDKISK